MKWMIASDIHGSAYYCRELLKAYEQEGADRLLLLGDLLYHGRRKASFAYGAIARRKWIRWCLGFPCWRIMPFSVPGKE